MSSLAEAATTADIHIQPTDLEIHCSQAIFRVHRAVVCPQSSVLSAICGEGKEDITRVESCFDAGSVNLMLHFLYTGGYDVDMSEIATSTNALLSKSFEEHRYEAHEATRLLFIELREHANAFALGDLYHITGLKSQALQKFRAARRRCNINAPKDFMDIATVIFTRDDLDVEPLRDELVAMAVDHKISLAHHEDFIEAISTRPEFRTFVAPFIEALIALPPAATTTSTSTAPDSFDQTVNIQRDNYAQEVTHQAELDRLRAEHNNALQQLRSKHDDKLQHLRSEHDKRLVALARKHDAEIESLSEKYEDELFDTRTGLPTPENRRELLERLNRLARGFPACKNSRCGASPLSYKIEWQGIGFLARCTECGTKHEL